MIQIKPFIQFKSNCPYCDSQLTAQGILWAGVHVCADAYCTKCNTNIIGDLEIGHAITHPYLIDLKGHHFFREKDLLGGESSDIWLGKPLLESLQNPNHQSIQINEEIFKSYKQVVILNCIDYLYGHSLLKLLNADTFLRQNPNTGLVVVVQKFLRWMVPEGCTEVWTVDIPLRQGRSYYTQLNRSILEKMERFDEVYLHPAHSHPKEFDITQYTRVPKHNFKDDDFRITFIWREDRLWLNDFLFRVLRKIGMTRISLYIQNWKIKRLLAGVRKELPMAKFTVAGLGIKTKFPGWIDDVRVEKFNEELERNTCKIYSQSRLVVGVHGSNMLLPSAHAGMTLDIMPNDRSGNICQDIAFQETDPRLATFRYRFPPIDIKIPQLAKMAISMINKYNEFVINMMYKS